MSEAEGFYREEANRYLREGYERQTGGEVEEAIGLYKKSLEIHPTPEAYTFLGWAYSFKGRFHEAIEECRKAIRLDPDFGNPYNDIGAYLIEQRKLDDAIPWLEKAMQAKRYESYFYPHYNLGRIWEQKGQWQKAMKCYSEALRLKPDYRLAQKAIKRLQVLMN